MHDNPNSDMKPTINVELQGVLQLYTTNTTTTTTTYLQDRPIITLEEIQEFHQKKQNDIDSVALINISKKHSNLNKARTMDMEFTKEGQLLNSDMSNGTIMINGVVKE